MNYRSSLLLVPLILGCSASESAERVSEARTAVIDGRPASADEFFATVAIVSTMDDAPFCTGTLVAPTVVVTAAHCLFGEIGEALGPADMAVVSGALDANDLNQGEGYAVAETIGHSGYNNDGDPGGLGREDDIAVLILAEAVAGQTPVAVLAPDAFDTHIPAGTSLTITGYGAREETGMDETQSGVLYIAETPFASRSDQEFLAGGEGSPDTCPGDSGGPVYIDIEGTKYVIGASSRAAEPGPIACGTGGLYTFVGAYDSFLADSSGGVFTGVTSPSGTTPDASSSSATGGGGGGDDDSCSVSGRDASMTSFAWLLALVAGIRRRRR